MYRSRRRRLRGWDYHSPGMYFVTFCTYERRYLFGEIHEGRMHLSKAGMICNSVLTSQVNDGHTLDSFVVMPNHVHILIMIDEDVSVSAIVRTLKAQTTIRIKKMGSQGRIWQASFHDHIVRNEEDLLRVREYIQNNPLKWDLDCMNHEGVSQGQHALA